MAKLNFVQTQTTRKGVAVGSAWSNTKGGFGITLKGKIRDSQGKLVDVDDTRLIFKVGQNEYDMKLGNFNKEGEWQSNPAKLLAVPRASKREGKKDPDFTLYAYPLEEK